MKIKLVLITALLSHCISAFAIENIESDAHIQRYLNDNWPSSLLTAYTGFTCGNEDLGYESLKNLMVTTPNSILSSPIAYGFLTGYNNHLSSLQNSIDQKSLCEKASISPKEKAIAADDAITRINETINLNGYLGEYRAQGLMISLYSINKEYSSQLSKKLLIDACNMNSSNIKMPTLLDLVNSSGLTQKPDANGVKDIAQVWKGYSQGMYWHALSLVEKFSPEHNEQGISPKQDFCNKIN